jgi:hypothetical protein
MTQDFGFKISLPGVDVKTATPEQCSIHSSYDSLKVKLDNQNPQEGNILVTFNDTPAVGTYTITSIHHGYGYIPAYYFFFDIRSSSSNTGVEVGDVFPLDEGLGSYFQAIPDTQNIVFNFVTDGVTDVLAGNYYGFRFFVFANDGA